MNIEKLFQVIVAMGASSTVGLVACSSSSGTGSPASEDGGSTGATEAGGGTNADGSACTAVCQPDSQDATWIDCDGCCCWLPAGSTSPAATPICGAEPCCTGRGR